MCFMSEWLAYHNIIEDINNADFTLIKPNGEEIIVSIPAIEFYPYFLWSNVFYVENNTNPSTGHFTIFTKRFRGCIHAIASGRSRFSGKHSTNRRISSRTRR